MEWILVLLIFLAALLYSSVGHAGASGYLAAMAMFGVAPAVMRPSALALNVLVSLIATVKFYRAGYFSWRLFWPFALTSVPCAFYAGKYLTLPNNVYKQIVGAVLVYSAIRLFVNAANAAAETVQPPPVGIALAIGALIGLLSGLVGVGGGIFLSPLILLMGWAETRQTSGVAAAFILVNSVAGLAGWMSKAPQFPRAILWWIPAAVLGGWIGAEYGSKRLISANLRRLLALGLLIAASKLIFT